MKRRPGANRRGVRLPSSAPVSSGGGGGGVVTDGLVFNLDAGDASSYTPYTTPGTGLVWTDLANSAALTFSVVPGYSRSPGFINFRSSLTSGNSAAGTPAAISAIDKGALEIWFRWKTSSSNNTGVMLTSGGNWLNLGQTAGAAPTESVEYYNNGSGVNRLALQYVGPNDTFFFRDNEWHQLVVVVTGGGAPDPTTMYLDGNVIAPADLNYRIGSNASETLWNAAAITIGRLGANSYKFDGDIAIVRMYDRSGGGDPMFSAAEVAQNYAAESSRFSAFYPDTISKLTTWIDMDDADNVVLSGVDIVGVKDKAFALDSVAALSAGSPPTQVTLDGRNWAKFTGASTQYLNLSKGVNPLFLSDVFTTSGGAKSSWEIHVVARPDVSSTSAANPYDDESIIGDSGGWWGIATHQSGVAGNVITKPWIYDGASKFTDYDVVANTKHVFGSGMTLDSGTLKTYKNGVATSVASGNLGSNGGSIVLGDGYGKPYTGYIGEVCIFNEELTATERNNLMAYFQAKWGTP